MVLFSLNSNIIGKIKDIVNDLEQHLALVSYLPRLVFQMPPTVILRERLGDGSPYSLSLPPWNNYWHVRGKERAPFFVYSLMKKQDILLIIFEHLFFVIFYAMVEMTYEDPWMKIVIFLEKSDEI